MNARWTPRDPQPGTRCQNCGEQVLPGTVRVFGSNGGELFACPSCAPYRDLKQGAGSDPDYERGENDVW